MEHHQHEQPDEKKPIKSPENNDSPKKKSKKRRKIRRPIINVARYSPDKNKPIAPIQAEIWAWPRLKPKLEQKPVKSPEEAASTLVEPVEAQPTEVIYQEDELSDELTLEESSQIVTIPLSSYSESEILLRGYSDETIDTDNGTSDTKAKLQPLADSQVNKSEEPLLVEELAVANLRPALIEDNSEIDTNSQIPATADMSGEQITSLSEDQAPTAIKVETEPIYSTDDRVNEAMLGITLDNTQAGSIDPSLIRSADYQVGPEIGTAAGPSKIVTEPNLPSKLADWWHRLPKPKLLNFYSKKSYNPPVPSLTATGTATERHSPNDRNYESSSFRRSIGRHLSVSDFVKQLKEAPKQREPRSEPTIIDQVAASKPLETITKVIPNFRPQLAEVSAATVGSMNYILKSTPYYPEHYQRNAGSEPGKINETWKVDFKPEDHQNPARLKIDEDLVIPSPVESNWPSTTPANTPPAYESTSLTDKSWDEIVAIEAERLRIASHRRPENQSPVLGNKPTLSNPEFNQPPDVPPELPSNREVQSSVWHRIEVDKKTGRAVETPTLAYGEAFQQEQHQEIQQPLSEDTTTVSGQPPVGPMAQVDLPHPSSFSAKVEPVIAPESQPTPNQTESTIRVRQSSPLNLTDLWLWIILIIVILAVVIAISV
jgi:hypothetical protein